MFGIVQGRLADQKVKQDWGTSCDVTRKNCELRSLICVNKSGATVWLQVFDTDDGAATGVPDEYPLPANSILSINDLRFYKGLFVRAVTAADGSSVIGANDVQFRADFQTGPVS